MSNFDRIEQYVLVDVILIDVAAVDRAVEIGSDQ